MALAAHSHLWLSAPVLVAVDLHELAVEAVEAASLMGICSHLRRLADSRSPETHWIDIGVLVFSWVFVPGLHVWDNHSLVNELACHSNHNIDGHYKMTSFGSLDIFLNDMFPAR